MLTIIGNIEQVWTYNPTLTPMQFNFDYFLNF